MRLPIHLVVFTLGFLVCFYSRRSKLMRSLAVRLGDSEDSWESTETDAGREWLVYLQRTLGFVLMGVIPFVLLSIAESGVFQNSGAEGAPIGVRGAANHGVSRAAELSGAVLPGGGGVVLWTLLPVGLALAFTWVRSGARIPLEVYPDVRRAEWPMKRVMLNALFWILYVIGFEYFLRGYLLFPLFTELGIDGAIALNACVYALASSDEGPMKALGAFFMGIIFCMVALATHSFVIPLIMHIILRVGKDMRAVSASWEMQFVSARGD